MSRNKASDKKKKQQEGKVSFFGEMSMLSVTATIGLVALVILCVAFYAFMSSSPSKKIRVDDDAGIFTRSQIGDLEDMARQLSRRKDINVVIVTTRDKGRGYSNSDEDCERFAADYYKKACIKTSLVNNSGICILIDLTIDEPGQRFFWLYTYGTAYFAVSDDECMSLFRSQKSLLSDGQYYDALENILDDLDGYDYRNTSSVTFFCLIIPAGLAFVITLICTASKGLDKKPQAKQYKTPESSLELSDKVTSVKRIYNPPSSSSGGGGGGGFSGGGGGGHSGGGGGRF